MEGNCLRDGSDGDPLDLIGAPFAVIESDPGVFTMLMRKLGVHGLEVMELYDIEPWAVDHLDPHGLIFCYLCADENGTEDEDVQDDCDAPDPDAQDIWFANQLSDDACASQAMLNIIFNCRGVQLDPSLHRFHMDTEKMSWVMKGLAITNCQFIREAQNSLARPADLRAANHSIATKISKEMKHKNASTATPASKKRKSTTKTNRGKKQQKTKEDQQDTFHFIAYVPCDGKVWELDGLRISGPLEVGEISDAGGPSGRQGWMDVVRPALKLKMQRHLSGEAREQIRYNLLAIVDDQYMKFSDALEMQKRERSALERRLDKEYPNSWSDKVNENLLVNASQVFSTSVHSSDLGPTYAQDFGSRKMVKDMSILDMPVRSLPSAWEACVQAAMAAKVSVEDEITKSKNMNADFIRRTFDYEPFIQTFVTCLQEEGLLQPILSGQQPSNNEPSTAKAKSKPKKRSRR
ncbi:unnamed protein product [Somion occarium]|uniref:ubiquitinyl hydrolase 1 n=2 Tax=Somion occarium TaxID=3059160 RepID=A0ABP1D5T0_9APHY